MNSSFLDRLIEALMTVNPSAEIEALRASGELEREIPALTRMVGAHQSRQYHQEDVWDHTMMVLDLAATIRDQASDPTRFMLAALFHDTGKPITEAHYVDLKTGETVYHNSGHPEAGAYVAETVLRRYTDDRELRDYVFDFVGNHHIVYDIDRALKANGNVVDERINARLHLKYVHDYVLFSREADAVGVIPGKLSNIRPDLFLELYMKTYPEYAGRY